MKIPLIALLLLTVACAPVGPDYTRPAVKLEPGFVEGTSGTLGEVATRQWWTQFQDARLNALVGRGLQQNLSIANALERIKAAQATLGTTGAAEAASGSLAASRTRSGSEDTATTDSHSTSLSASFVLDLFGGLRRNAQSARASLAAARADEGTVRLAYLSAIVGAYIDARYYQESMALTRQTIALREQTLKLTLAKVEAGNATEYEQVQIQALLDSARADLPSLESSYLTEVYTMATLLGEPAAPLIKEMQSGRNQPRPHGKLNTGIPADLLRNRPDVRAAEQDLIGATADVGVAEAALLPSITLSGSLTNVSSKAWSFGPSVSLPVFSQPRLMAAKANAVSLAKQAEITWRSTILSAVEDVQSAHSQWLRLQQVSALRQSSVTSYARAAELSEQAYQAGATDLSDLLDDDRSLASARLSLASSVRDLAVQWAATQVALGAGAYAQ